MTYENRALVTSVWIPQPDFNVIKLYYWIFLYLLSFSVAPHEHQWKFFLGKRSTHLTIFFCYWTILVCFLFCGSYVSMRLRSYDRCSYCRKWRVSGVAACYESSLFFKDCLACSWHALRAPGLVFSTGNWWFVVPFCSEKTCKRSVLRGYINLFFGIWGSWV